MTRVTGKPFIMSSLAAAGTAPTSVPSNTVPPDMNTIQELINDLNNRERREVALAELSRFREAVPEMATLLWSTPGVATVLLVEVCSIYTVLLSNALSSQDSTRVCNALALMQCLASHDETRKPFLEAQIPLFLYPCLGTTNKARPYEYLRLTCLGVIGALVKTESPEVVEFLLSTEVVPLCLRIMETGNELSRTVAIFIIQKILLDANGLSFVCQTNERLLAILAVLASMVQQVVEQRSLRLLKHIVRCYLRLSDNKKALLALLQMLPAALRDGTFETLLLEDPVTAKFASELISRLSAITTQSSAQL